VGGGVFEILLVVWKGIDVITDNKGRVQHS